MKYAKKATIAISEFIEEIAKLKGTSFSMMVGISVGLKLTKLGFLIRDFDEILEEFKVMDTEDKAALCLEFEQEFDLPNDEAEIKIEQTYEWLLTTYELIKLYIKKEDKTAV